MYIPHFFLQSALLMMVACSKVAYVQMCIHIYRGFEVGLCMSFLSETCQRPF